MRYLAALLLLCSTLTHAAPPDGFALIHDADGYTNLRESPDLNAKVLAKIPNGTPLECVGEASKDNPNFCTALLQQAATSGYGFIHRSRLIFPASDKNFATLHEHFGRGDTLTLSSNGQTVHIAARRIHPKRSDFSGTAPNSDTTPLYRGKPFYGTDGLYSEKRICNRTDHAKRSSSSYCRTARAVLARFCHHCTRQQCL